MKVVLVVDDDVLVRDSIKDLLEASGFRVLTAENGRVGLERAQKYLPDLVLCDIQMPEVNGYNVLASLQSNPATRSIPLIFLTARTDKLAIRQGMNLGADDYLVKPCSVEELLSTVHSRLTKQETLRSQSQQKLEDLRSSIALSLPHELRTPLTGILTSVELLRTIAHEPNPAEILEIAATMEVSAQKLYQLIQNFLLYAKLEVAAHDPNFLRSHSKDTTLQPEVIIASAATQVAQQFERLPDLRLDLQPAVVGFSSFDLEKVIVELVSNAFKFSHPNTPVEVSSQTRADDYQIKITNYGRGMTAEQIANLGAYVQFDRKFYEQQGVGLGLTIAKRLIDLWGGHLTIESNPDQLTTVSVVIQLAANEAEVE